MKNNIKVALVHDYLREYGGAERVLEAFTKMWPEAPIYTAFAVKGSAAMERFGGRRIVESWAARIPGFASKLHSPLRFLAPQIWSSFDFSEFDVVVSSSSWYMTKGVRVPEKCLHVAYIHTPPRYLYGYATAANYQKLKLVKIYAGIVNKELRQYDYETAQKVDVLVANSEEVRRRIGKFWRRGAKVIYPPVSINSCDKALVSPKKREAGEEYYLTGGRLVGPKHFEVVIEAANKVGAKLKIFGSGPEEGRLRAIAGQTVEFVGRVDEETLGRLYRGAKAFVALADDEDFGITPVEAMMWGTPVLAYRGGGYKESVVEGETGIFVGKLTTQAVVEGMRKISNFKFQKSKILDHAKRFSQERFEREMNELVESEWEKKHARIT